MPQDLNRTQDLQLAAEEAGNPRISPVKVAIAASSYSFGHIQYEAAYELHLFKNPHN